MKTILFLNNQYIDSLSSLRQLFKGNINNILRRDILCAFQDGVISKWLAEGDEECNTVKLALDKIDMDLSNQEHMDKLKLVFANERLHTNASIKFENYCVVENVTYCRYNKYGNIINPPHDIGQDGIKFEHDQKVNFQLFLAVKIVNPDNEIMELKLSVNDKNQKCLYDSYTQLPINAKKNEIKYVSFHVELDNVTSNTSLQLTLTHQDKVIWKSTVVKGNANMKIVVGDKDNVTFKMVYVDGGTFNMGETSGMENKDDLTNVHKVTLSPFYIAETVVTQALWKTVMKWNLSNCEGIYNPVEYVSWENCQKFIEILNEMTGMKFRLPTEAEWEFAARGGNSSNHTLYSGSNNIDDVAWCSINSLYKTHPVAQKIPNELGLYDMSGNVWEWCEDFYGEYMSKDEVNPKGPKFGSKRIARGGSWNYPERYCQVFFRNCFAQNEMFNGLGLRLAMSVKE